MKIKSIPLSQLVSSPANVRKTNATTGIEELADQFEVFKALIDAGHGPENKAFFRKDSRASGVRHKRSHWMAMRRLTARCAS